MINSYGEFLKKFEPFPASIWILSSFLIHCYNTIDNFTMFRIGDKKEEYFMTHSLEITQTQRC